jgi:hypothetical protein
MKHRNSVFLMAACAACLYPAFALAGSGSSGFATVGSDGTLLNGRGATGAIHFTPGNYEVDFDHNVSNCVFTATLSAPGGGVAPGSVTVAGRANTTSAVYVETFDSSGNDADRGFSLNVRCLQGKKL